MDTWKRGVVACVLVVLSAAGAHAQVVQKDDPRCKDHPMFTRMPTYWIHGCKESQFDRFSFIVGDNNKKEDVEGRQWYIRYYPQASAKDKPSQLQILKNFEAAVKPLGGTLVWSGKDRETLKIPNGGTEVWVDVVAAFTGSYFLTIVEKGGMAQDIVADAAALGSGLKATGHVTVEGIYFDTGKAVLKPESARALGEVAKLLQGDPALKVYVVGHTDTVGALEANMKLSQDRADAVVQELVKAHGIGAARLKPFGNGPYAPVASNDADAGRAKNRRVELVKQ